MNHAHTPAPPGRCTRQTHSSGVPFHRQAFHMGTTRDMIGILVKDPDEGGEQGGVGRRHKRLLFLCLPRGNLDDRGPLACRSRTCLHLHLHGTEVVVTMGLKLSRSFRYPIESSCQSLSWKRGFDRASTGARETCTGFPQFRERPKRHFFSRMMCVNQRF